MTGKKQQRGVNGLVWAYGRREGISETSHMWSVSSSGRCFPPCSLKVPPTHLSLFFTSLHYQSRLLFLLVKGAASGHLYPDADGQPGVASSSWVSQVGRAASRSVGRTRKEARATRRSLVKHDSPLLGLSQSQGLINIYSFRLGERALHAH